MNFFEVKDGTVQPHVAHMLNSKYFKFSTCGDHVSSSDIYWYSGMHEQDLQVAGHHQFAGRYLPRSGATATPLRRLLLRNNR